MVDYVTDVYDTIPELVAAIEQVDTTVPIQIVAVPYWAAHRFKNDYKYLLIQGAA